MPDHGPRTTQGSSSLIAAQEMQSDWFVREVRKCMEIGMPLGCCDEWPECSHILAWVETRQNDRAVTLMARCVACHHEADVSDARDVPMCPKCFSPMVVTEAGKG